MKTTLHYSEKMTLCIHALGMTATIDLGCKPLADTLEYVEHIFNDDTMFRCECVDCVHIINSETGELIAECEPDHKSGDDEIWPTPEEIFEDWGFNEDMGYDPYLGCYSDDC